MGWRHLTPKHFHFWYLQNNPPDFLWILVALTNLMRLSSLKAAHALPVPARVEVEILSFRSHGNPDK